MDERTEGRAGGHRESRELAELELRLTGLVFARAILERRGASAQDLDALSRETAYLRWRLTHRAQAAHGGYDAAA
jgi:hypothetical protein